MLDELSANARRQRDYGEALRIARAMLAVDPWREDVIRRAIATRVESGDSAGALAEYERFRERVQREMGVAPMPETQALAESIARCPSPVSMLPFVGREREFGQLLAAWERAQSGAFRFVTIGGEPGIGKTRLAREAVATIELRGGRTMWGAVSGPEAFPYEPFVDALRSALPLVAALELAPSSMALLAELVPELKSRVRGLVAPVALDVVRERDRVRDVFVAVASALAAARPLAIVLEDVQWAGDATLDLIETLATRLRGTRSMIVATYREDETPRSHPIRRLARVGGDAEGLVLGPLDVPSVEAIARAANADGTGVSAGEVAVRCGGNPLFATQLVGHVGGPDRGLPENLEAAIAARLGGLAPETRALAETAALSGERFSLEVARDVLAWDERRAFASLDDLLDRRIVCEGGGRAAFPYMFVHRIVQEIAADAIASEARSERHLRIARATERRFAGRVGEFSAEIARHYAAGGDEVLAADHYLAAARRAASFGALSEARAFATKSLAFADAADVRRRLEVLLVLEELESRSDAGRTPQATLDELLRLANELDDAELCCAVRDRRASVYFRRGDEAAMRGELRALYARADADGLPHWRARADYLESLRLETAENAHASAEAARRAATWYLSAGDIAGAANATSQVACVCADAGELAAASEALEQGLALAERSGHYEPQSQALFAGTVVALRRGDAEAMLDVARRWHQHASAAGDIRTQVRALNQLGLAEMFALDFGAATRAYREALPLAEHLNLTLVVSALGHNFGALHAAIGDFGSAQHALRRVREGCRSRNDERGVGETELELALPVAFAGDFAGGLELAEHAIASARKYRYANSLAGAFEAYGEIVSLMGSGEDADAALREALAIRTASGSPNRIGYVRSLLATHRASAGFVDEAREIVEPLSLEWRAFAGTAWPERIAWNVACVYRTSGDVARADAWTSRARELLAQARASIDDARALTFFDAVPWRVAISGS